MNILCVMHADFEPPGIIKTWALQKGHHFKTICPYKGDLPLVHNDFDFLIVMGGPQSPLELEKAPYLSDEIMLIKQSIDNQKFVLGFCLGAQLIGEALGAKTMRSPNKEVGVFPVSLTKEVLTDPLLQGLPSSFPVIHWHNDMPGLTNESVLLGYSEGCPRQIIRYQKRVYGFQCHLEITLEGIKTMISSVPDDLKPSKFVQSAEELMQQDYHSINQRMCNILDRFVTIL